MNMKWSNCCFNFFSFELNYCFNFIIMRYQLILVFQILFDFKDANKDFKKKFLNHSIFYVLLKPVGVEYFQ